MRIYPAIDITWTSRSESSDDEQAGLVMAAIDEEGPTAAEPITHGVRVFFPTPAARGRAALKLAGADLPVTRGAVDAPDDWAERSQAGLEPIVVGGSMVAAPDVNPGLFLGPVIRIQPSMGFGTGHHASTRLMLDLLQRQALAGRSVLDVGTGSGTALAARVLGAGRVVAIDVDPDALASAQLNCTLNKAGQITLLEADVASATGSLGRTFDLVLANLTGRPSRATPVSSLPRRAGRASHRRRLSG